MKRKIIASAVAVCFFTSAGIAQSTLPAYVPTSDLRAYYNLDSNTNDLSGNGNNGVGHNLLSTSDRHGNPNNAYFFSGSNSHIMINPTTSVLDIQNGSSSVSAWVKLNPALVGTADQNIFWRGDTLGGQDPYTMGLGRGHYYYLRDGLSNRDTISSPFVDTLFHHLVATYDSATAIYNLYFDGVLTRTKTGIVSVNYNTSHMWNVIGAIDRGQHQNFTGVIDDIALYGRALVDCEVQQLYTEQATFISQQPNNFQAVLGSSASFTTASSAANGTYQWQASVNGTSFFDLNMIGSYSGVTTSTLTINPVVASNYNEYYRCKISSGGCDHYTQVVRILSPQSVSTSAFDNGVEIFPNPVAEKVTFRFKNLPAGETFLSITNMLGQQIYRAAASEKEFSISRTTFGAAGLYQVRVSDVIGNVWATERLLVE